jgi:hypothetical protein
MVVGWVVTDDTLAEDLPRSRTVCTDPWQLTGVLPWATQVPGRHVSEVLGSPVVEAQRLDDARDVIAAGLHERLRRGPTADKLWPHLLDLLALSLIEQDAAHKDQPFVWKKRLLDQPVG